ncbi:MAG: hypothetical protein R3C56_30160 [Pirellulaceae bacterium]
MNGLFVNGPIDIIAGLTQLPGVGSGEGSAGDNQGNDLVGGEHRKAVAFQSTSARCRAANRCKSFSGEPSTTRLMRESQSLIKVPSAAATLDMFLTDDPDLEPPGMQPSRSSMAHRFSPSTLVTR